MTTAAQMTELGAKSPDRLLAINAGVGLLTWIGLLSASLASSAETALIERLLLVAPLVTVPLGLAITIQGHKLLAISQPIAAGLLIISLLSVRGWVAGLLACGWLLFTGVVALLGLARLWARGVRPLQELCIDAGLVYLPIGGAWLVASRIGLQPMGFGDTIVLLTAVHFHYAGFAAPILAGKAGDTPAISDGWARKAYLMSAAGVIAGPPLVALGISTSLIVEVASAVLLAGALLLLAVITVTAIAPRCQSRMAALLLVVSSISFVVTMALACEYSIGHFLGSNLIEIPQMARTHGIINVFGASLCGLTGWYLESKATPGTARFQRADGNRDGS